MKESLLKFQREAIAFYKEKRRVLINLPAGSGKSRIALECCSESGPSLILCPTFLSLNWNAEILKWFPSASIEFGFAECADFVIVGYSKFQSKKDWKKWGKPLMSVDWATIICDESQYLRRWEAERTKQILLKGIARGRRNIIFMTATPIVTSAADLHPIYSTCQPGKWESYGDFKEKFCDKEQDVFSTQGFKYVGTNEENAAELRKRRNNFVFHRKKSVVLAQLPDKRTISVPLDIGGGEHFEDISDYIDRISEDDATDDNDEIKTERERIGVEKIPHIIEFLDTLPADEQVVIFAHHRRVIKDLSRILDCPMIIGGMDNEKRHRLVVGFQKKKFNRFVVSISAGGLGLNLQCASIAIFAEEPYSDAEFEQCSDRVHRLGSKKRVTIYDLYAVDTMDEDIRRHRKLKRKAAKLAGVKT